MSLHVFGIRHHGPGCARSLRQALDSLRPDIVLLEGPPDAEEILALAADEQMRPPVALLIYPDDEPGRAVFFPLAVYSPEWQTLQWTCQQNVPLRLIDLPMRHRLALDIEAEKAGRLAEEQAAATAPDANGQPERAPHQPGGDDVTLADPDEQPAELTWRADPIALLAEAAGYRDHELWWEEQVERRADATGLFSAISEAMQTVRGHVPETREHDLLREAHMRTAIRAAVKEGFQRIAVVCGAWHAPVLDEAAIAGQQQGCTSKDDAARLKGLPRIKTQATWIPWTYSRLTYRSGYGAGIESPGWYAHLWQASHQAPARWVATAARLLRSADLDASSASVIEAVRLADALAALREIRSPGLRELNEAVLSVLCHGDHAPMRLIRDRLEIGDRLGAVPDQTPSVPLAGDLARLQKSLRLKPSTEIKLLDLDLRNATDLARSHLLHRLALLNIAWGQVQQTGSRTSTFHEIWRIQWQPEFAVSMIEASVWGNTVEAAATAKAVHDGRQAAELAQITELLDAAIIAGLAAAIEPLLERIQGQAAVASDVRQLMDALPPLARVVRYGDVRGTQAAQVLPVILGMFERAQVGLGAACSSLDDDAAERMLKSIGHVQEALDLLDRDDLREPWQRRLRQLADGSVHGLLRGWACRLLLEKGALGEEELYRTARLALSPANDTLQAAAWVSGLLRGSGLLLVHQESVWQVFDHWLSELQDETFVELLPLLRRAFADFSPAERRQMGEKVKQLARGDAPARPAAAAAAADIDHDRARLVLPVLAHILGVAPQGDGENQ